MHIYIRVAQFYDFIVVGCCYTLDMHILQSLKTIRIFKIKIRLYFPFIYFAFKTSLPQKPIGLYHNNSEVFSGLPFFSYVKEQSVIPTYR